jgi:hypothetical protein
MGALERFVQPGQASQGDVSQSIKQVFTTERTRILEFPQPPPLKPQAVLESILKDQFGNLYLEYQAVLLSGELHTISTRVGAEKWDGTSKRTVLLRKFSKFGGFNDALIDALRTLAFFSIASENEAYLKGRLAANLVANVG